RSAADHSPRGSGQQGGLLSDLGWAFCVGARGEPVLRELQGCRRPMRGSEQLSCADLAFITGLAGTTMGQSSSRSESADTTSAARKLSSPSGFRGPRYFHVTLISARRGGRSRPPGGWPSQAHAGAPPPVAQYQMRRATRRRNSARRNAETENAVRRSADKTWHLRWGLSHPLAGFPGAARGHLARMANVKPCAPLRANRVG